MGSGERDDPLQIREGKRPSKRVVVESKDVLDAPRWKAWVIHKRWQSARLLARQNLVSI
jgi:hypothetical protein